MLGSILVGMSGGVDSSVALLLLKNEGYEVSGATIVMFDNEDIGLNPTDSVCGSGNELASAKKLAQSMGCLHYTITGKEEFCESVMEYFAGSYEAGETPNPCAMCNKTVKFPKLLKQADMLGIEKIATGHYARIKYDENTKKYKLLCALDKKKDQSYFLYGLGQSELARIL
ncbi:MAG: tRNA 2-thiouridine(34) synthase MnmA, partial [Eubacteriales bacterium]